MAAGRDHLKRQARYEVTYDPKGTKYVGLTIN